MEKLIIDTDPALGVPFRDVDDGVAIALALNSPELEIIGITLTYGNTNLGRTYKSIKSLLAAAGRKDIPVFRGARSPATLGKETDASRFISETLSGSPGDVSLLTLGPVTNAATAEMNDPNVLKKARRVVAMGGAVFGPGLMPPFFRTEFNFWNDPRATAVFIDSVDELVLVPVELTMRTSFRWRDLQKLRNTGNPLAEKLYREILHWYFFMSAVRLRDGFPPHDPLAVAWMLRPDLFKTREAQVKVITAGPFRGETRRISHGGRKIVVTTDVDECRFLEFLTGRLVAS